MRGGHDLGGQVDMGPVNPEDENEEPVFHAEWERRVFALTLAAGMLGQWNIDESRHARERQDPLTYVKNSYYENWLEGLEKLLVEKELISKSELQEAVPAGLSQASQRFSVPNSKEAKRILYSGAPSLMETDSEPLFQIGDKALVKQSDGTGHTRSPRYAQGFVGTISARLGCHNFPDSNAAGGHEAKQLYTVIFDGTDLWGSESEQIEVAIDLWEPYLEQANA